MEYKTTKLKLLDVLVLDIELNGNNQLKLKGLLSFDMIFTTRYLLTKISEQVKKEKAEYEAIKLKGAEKYGVKNGDENSYSVEPFIEEKKDGQEKPELVKNPNYELFMNEMDGLLKTETEIKVPSNLTLNSFEKVTSNEDCSTLISLLD